MEKFKKLEPMAGIRNILRGFDKLNVSERTHHELKQCAEAILTLNVDKVRNGTVNDRFITLDGIVIALIKFAEITFDMLAVCQVLSPQYGIICSTVVEVVGYVFIADVASSILKRFSHTNAIEADFRARCRATTTKVTQCITYMQGLPEPEVLDRSEKQFHLQLMASDAPVHTGLDELLALGVKITDMVKSSAPSNFGHLMENIQLYCCLATFRELFLLYRFAVQTTFETDAKAVKDVCDAQRAHDESVLKFLFEPTVKTTKLSFRYRAEEWSVVSSFLDRRGLHLEDLSGMGGEIVQIKSMYFRDRTVSVRKNLFTAGDGICCEDNPDEQCTLFQLQGGKNNVFTIHPCAYDTPCHISDNGTAKLNVSAGVPSPVSGLWHIQKIYPDSQDEVPCFIIRLAADDKRCIYASMMNGQIYAKSMTETGPRFLWQLINAEHTYFRRF